MRSSQPRKACWQVVQLAGVPAPLLATAQTASWQAQTVAPSARFGSKLRHE